MNLVHNQRRILGEKNYVLKANDKSFYWFGVSKSLIDDYVAKFADNFNIILYGDEMKEADFYVIPYNSIKDLLTPESLYLQKERFRWVGDIHNHILRIRKSKTDRNVSHFYSLPLSTTASELAVPAKEIFNDYSIENAKREISVRLKQSKFRKIVLHNFNSQCCLSGVREEGLLVASHIIPWSDKISTRLDPSNGLCLSTLYDALFDRGYFTIDHELNVIVSARISSLSDYIRQQLLFVSGNKITSPGLHTISHKSIEFHNKHVFEKFS